METRQASEQPTRFAARPGTLAAIVGFVAAGLLLADVPAEESGRKVTVSLAPDGMATVRHVVGPQYLKSYLDIAGVPTACDGITRGVKLGQVRTEVECGRLLEVELVRHAAEVMACTPGLRREGMDYQRFAAVSLAYNIGTSAYCGSTAARLFNAGRPREACDAFLRWNKARVRGELRPVKGLTARRQRERAACLKGVA